MSQRPAAPAARVRAQGLFELRLLLRNGEQLLVSLILPLLALIGLAMSTVPSLGPGRRIDIAVPGVLALCVISSAFTAQAIATGFDRRYAVLRYLGVTPLGRDGLLAGKAVATLAMVGVQVLVIGGVGLVLGWRPSGAGLVIAPVFLVLGVWVFVALALVLAGLLRAEGVLAVANLLWVLFLVLGPGRWPAGGIPRWVFGGRRGGGAARLGRGRDRCGVAHVPVERLRVAHGIPLAVVESGT